MENIQTLFYRIRIYAMVITKRNTKILPKHTYIINVLLHICNTIILENVNIKYFGQGKIIITSLIIICMHRLILIICCLI